MTTSPTAAATADAMPDIARGVDAEIFAPTSAARRSSGASWRPSARLHDLPRRRHVPLSAGAVGLPAHPRGRRARHRVPAVFGLHPARNGEEAPRNRRGSPSSRRARRGHGGLPPGGGVLLRHRRRGSGRAKDALVLSFGWPLLLGSLWLAVVGWVMPDRSRTGSTWPTSSSRSRRSPWRSTSSTTRRSCGCGRAPRSPRTPTCSRRRRGCS
jgi:hypothetical protein